MRPSRFDLMLEYSREFVSEWFDQNPLGQIGIVGMREGIAEKICGMSGQYICTSVAYLDSNTVGTPQDVLKTIADRRKLEPSGAPSLQNALEMVRAHMRYSDFSLFNACLSHLRSYLPTHSSKEVVILFGSLTTVDPGNVHDTLKGCIKDGIQISVVALAAEMKICRDFCHDTGGRQSIRPPVAPDTCYHLRHIRSCNERGSLQGHAL